MSRIRPYLTAAFWIDTAERAVKTAAQTVVGVIVADGTSLISDVTWTDTAELAALALILSALTSVGSAQIGEHGTAAATPHRWTRT